MIEILPSDAHMAKYADINEGFLSHPSFSLVCSNSHRVNVVQRRHDFAPFRFGDINMKLHGKTGKNTAGLPLQ